MMMIVLFMMMILLGMQMQIFRLMKKTIPYVRIYGEATGKERIKNINHKIHNLKKRKKAYEDYYLLADSFLHYQRLDSLYEEKKLCLEKIEALRKTITPYGLMGKYWIFKNK